LKAGRKESRPERIDETEWETERGNTQQWRKKGKERFRKTKERQRTTEKANEVGENWRNTVDERKTIRQQWRKKGKERFRKTNERQRTTEKAIEVGENW